MKSYRNAAEVLPRELIEQLQQYVQGVQIYVPIKGEPARWGAKSGIRRRLAERNAEIRSRYAAGESIEALMKAYFLSYDSLRKIVEKTRGINLGPSIGRRQFVMLALAGPPNPLEGGGFR